MNRPSATHLAATTCLVLAAVLLGACDKKNDANSAVVTPTKSEAPVTDAANSNANSNTKSVAAPKTKTPPAPIDDNAAPALPGYWFASNIEEWVGKRWSEIDLFHYMKTKPTGLSTGRRYIVFYSRTCDHCADMFNDDLATDPGLAAMVTAVEVPQEKGQLTSPDAWAMPQTECEMLSLPLGADWIITTPMTLRIEDGVIACAMENDHKECMGLE